MCSSPQLNEPMKQQRDENGKKPISIATYLEKYPTKLDSVILLTNIQR